MTTDCQNNRGVRTARTANVPVNGEAADARRYGLLCPVVTMAPAGCCRQPIINREGPSCPRTSAIRLSPA